MVPPLSWEKKHLAALRVSKCLKFPRVLLHMLQVSSPRLLIQFSPTLSSNLRKEGAGLSENEEASFRRMRRESLPAFCEKGEIWREKVFSLEERRLDAGWGVAWRREEIYVGVSGGALLFHLLLFFTADRALLLRNISHFNNGNCTKYAWNYRKKISIMHPILHTGA